MTEGMGAESQREREWEGEREARGGGAGERERERERERESGIPEYYLLIVGLGCRRRRSSGCPKPVLGACLVGEAGPA